MQNEHIICVIFFITLCPGVQTVFTRSTINTRLLNVDFLGIQDKDGKYLINLPAWTRSVYKAGTRITYIHNENQYNDEIIIPGPATEELRLVVRLKKY